MLGRKDCLFKKKKQTVQSCLGTYDNKLEKITAFERKTGSEGPV